MNKLHNRIILGMASALMLMMSVTGCTKDEIDKWDAKGYVWFTDTITQLSFIDHSDVAVGQDVLVGIPITVATKMSDQDRTINVEVAEQPKNSQTKFEVQNPVVLHKNCTVDTMWVKVTHTANIDADADEVTFRIVASDAFDTGLKSNLVNHLQISNKYVCPSWWDSNAEYYIGYFSELKMKIILAVTGSTDDPRGEKGTWYNNIAIDYLIMQCNDYAVEHDMRYPDDDPNAPGQYPVFDFWGY